MCLDPSRSDGQSNKRRHSAGLIVSGTTLDENNSESFSMISLTFENKNEEWMRFDRIEVLIDEDAAKYVSVVKGKDLLDWASAMESRERLKRQRDEVAQLSLAALGAATAVVAAHNNDANAAYAGLGVMAGTQGWAISDALRYRKDWAQNPSAVPSEHVTTPFAVPGKMFLRRWLLLNKPSSKSVSVLPLALHTVDGRRQVVMVKLQ